MRKLCIFIASLLLRNRIHQSQSWFKTLGTISVINANIVGNLNSPANSDYVINRGYVIYVIIAFYLFRT